MKVHEFNILYANVPMNLRFVALSFIRSVTMTISDVYKRIGEIDNEIRPLEVEQQELLEIAEKYLKDIGHAE